jgi:hypothetical protein
MAYTFSQKMTDAPNVASTRCDLCGDTIDRSEIALVGDKRCCRPCSASIRSDLSLIDAFVEWHHESTDIAMRITRMPSRTEFRPGRYGAVVEFEASDILGSISMREDGQCDADVIRQSTGEQVLCTYAILITPQEVRDHLSATYKTIKREQVGAQNP